MYVFFMNLEQESKQLKQEKELVEQARKSPEAFGKLFEEYYDRIFSYAVKRVADIKVAEDITSEVFFKAYQKLWQFRWRNIPFSAWLYKITHHEISFYFRKRKYATLPLDEFLEKKIVSQEDVEMYYEELQEMKSQLEHQHNYLYLHSYLVKLPSKYQEVITLRFFEDKKVKEIALLLNKPEGTIKSLISRGLSLLKKKILQQESQIVQRFQSLKHYQE